MIGLDAAGKSQILSTLTNKPWYAQHYTIGFNVDTIKHQGYSLTIWDVLGAVKVRPLWHHYFQNTQVVIFVVDSNDRERIGDEMVHYNHCSKYRQTLLIAGYIREYNKSEIKRKIPMVLAPIIEHHYFEEENEHWYAETAKYELHRVMSDDELNDAILLVYANKQDLPDAMSVDEMSNVLELETFGNRRWKIQGTCAYTGDGLCEGLDWIVATLTSVKRRH